MALHWRMARVVLANPRLLPALLGLAWVMRPDGWYRRWPFVPLPDPSYLKWRMETAYGSSDAVPPLSDVAHYLAWSRRMRRGR